MRKDVLLVGGTALLLGLLTAPANAASTPGSCPLPFEGPVTFTQYVALPQHQAGLAEELYDQAYLQFIFDAVNHNGDSGICWKSIGNGNQIKSLYFVNVVDNNAAPK